MSEVKSEVNRQVELEELKKMQEAATSAMKDVQSSMNDVGSTLNEAKQGLIDSYDDFSDNGGYAIREPKTSLRQGRDSWGVKKSAMPQWYKKTAGVKIKIQSGAARVKRFRRAASQQKAPKSFF